MKTIIIFFSLSFLLFLFVSADPSPRPVLDAYGKSLRTGVNYYVMPAARDGENGGLLLAATGNKDCPSGVAQSQNEEIGLPLTITPVNPKKGVIRLSTDVNVKFSVRPTCNESNVWKLKYDKAMNQYAVMVGGEEGNPGPKTLDNWFKIEKTDDGYKFVFCPSVCDSCKVMCKDIGIGLDDKGVQRLVLSHDPLSVIFYL